jgi:hypothetical protein
MPTRSQQMTDGQRTSLGADMAMTRFTQRLAASIPSIPSLHRRAEGSHPQHRGSPCAQEGFYNLESQNTPLIYPSAQIVLALRAWIKRAAKLDCRPVAGQPVLVLINESEQHRQRDAAGLGRPCRHRDWNLMTRRCGACPQCSLTLGRFPLPICAFHPKTSAVTVMLMDLWIGGDS